MTEQEIINYLKENRNKGIALYFMPEEVQDYIWEHQDDTIFEVFIDEWERTENKVDWLSNHLPICLPDDTKKSYYMKTKVNVTFDVYSKVYEDTDINTFIKNYIESNICQTNYPSLYNISISCITEKINLNTFLKNRYLIKEEK